MNFNEHIEEHWKVDDKEWMKQRRADWKNIQWQLDRMRSAYVVTDDIKKKDYKYLKCFFLTGRDTQGPATRDLTPVGSVPNFVSRHVSFRSELLLHFWLGADHSQEYFEYLKENMYDDEDIKIDLFESTCIEYRQTVVAYTNNIKYAWNEEEGTTTKNGPIFGDLEPKLLELLVFTPKQEKWLDELIKKPRGANTLSRFERVFTGYFDNPSDPSAGCGFNPNNPVRYMLDEYVRWGFVQNRSYSFDDDWSFKMGIALAFNTIDTPEGRHPVQLEVAKELKQRILDARKGMTVEAQKRLEMVTEYYEKGGFLEDIQLAKEERGLV